MDSNRSPREHAKAASFLVRFWHEPRGAAGRAPVLRGWVRNLKTGEERYLNGPDQVVEHLRSQLESVLGELVGDGEALRAGG